VHAPYNIDAKINAAYVVLGLLYGQKDYTKTLEISTRAGQDSDCNPSTAAGVLGTMLGYANIPEFWKLGLKEAEDINFKYTKTSLNKVYQTSFDQALQMVLKNGGKINGDEITIKAQAPTAVKYEKSFEGLYPIRKNQISKKLDKNYEFEFEGTGFVLVGTAKKMDKQSKDIDIPLDIFIDGKKVSTIEMPTSYLRRREEIYWNYDLPKGKHIVKLVQKNQTDGYFVDINYSLIYSDKPNVGIEQHNH